MAAIDQSVALKFMAVFDGLRRAYGVYEIPKNAQVTEGGKLKGNAVTRRSPLMVDHWQRHLDGAEGLGVIPIKDGNTCRFGAIDVDSYNVNHQEIAARIKSLGLPLIVCRSKSGGAHLYVFTSEEVSAGAMQSRLRDVARFMGLGESEIFPKQATILTESGDVGQWINMPYFAGTRGMRYAIDESGNALNAIEFLRRAEELSVDAAWFQQKLNTADHFPDGPPCLQTLAQIGFNPGTRNNSLLAIGVYLKKINPDTWEADLEEYNRLHLNPPLTAAEIQGTQRSLRRKDYTYACARPPLAQHCDASLCRMRKYGIGGGDHAFPSLGGLTKLDTDPPIWFWTINGVRMALSTAELQNPRLFQARCIETVHMMPALPSQAVWQAAVGKALETVNIIKAPQEVSAHGQLVLMLEKFCTGRAQALALEEIVLGKPFTENGKTSFRLVDFNDFLVRQGTVRYPLNKITAMLNDIGAQHATKVMRARTVNYWTIAEFAKNEDPLEIPDAVKQIKDPF